MLDNWSKIATIAVAIVLLASAIIGPSIGGVFWLIRLEKDVERLEDNVKELQDDVAKLQDDVAQMKSDIQQIQANQQVIIEILRELSSDVSEIKTGLIEHTHDPDGRARLPLSIR